MKEPILNGVYPERFHRVYQQSKPVFTVNILPVKRDSVTRNLGSAQPVIRDKCHEGGQATPLCFYSYILTCKIPDKKRAAQLSDSRRIKK